MTIAWMMMSDSLI
jgi:ABC-type multidrug transport system fused ATPase/permease subunit